MKQIDIEVSTTISMTYDPESEEFKSALESYRDAIEDGASEEDMLRQIAWYITAFGTVSVMYLWMVKRMVIQKTGAE